MGDAGKRLGLESENVRFSDSRNGDHMARTTHAPISKGASYRTDGSIDRRWLDPAQVFVAGKSGGPCTECGAVGLFYVRHPRRSGKGTRRAFTCSRHLGRLTNALLRHRAASTPLGRRN